MFYIITYLFCGVFNLVNAIFLFMLGQWVGGSFIAILALLCFFGLVVCIRRMKQSNGERF